MPGRPHRTRHATFLARLQMCHRAVSSASSVRPIEESDQALDGGLIQDHLVAEAMRTGSGVAAGRLRQRVLESGGGCLLVWVRLWWHRVWIRSARGFGL